MPGGGTGTTHTAMLSDKDITSPLAVERRVIYYGVHKIAYPDCTKLLDGGSTVLPTANTGNP